MLQQYKCTSTFYAYNRTVSNLTQSFETLQFESKQSKVSLLHKWVYQHL